MEADCKIQYVDKSIIEIENNPNNSVGTIYRLAEFFNFDNEFIDRIYEFHKAFGERGTYFEINMYKDLFSILTTIDWSDYNVFKAVFRYIFIKNDENIAIFDLIFDTIFKHGKFLGKWPSIPIGTSEKDEKDERIPIQESDEPIQFKQSTTEKISETRRIKKGKKTSKSSDKKKNTNQKDDRKFKLNLEEEYLIEKSLKKNSLIMEIYTENFLQSSKNNSKIDNLKQYTKTFLEMNEFFLDYKKEMEELKNSLETDSIFKNNIDLLKQSYKNLNKRYIDYFPELFTNNDFKLNWLNEPRAKYSKDSEDMKKIINDPFVQFFVLASPVQLLQSLNHLENVLLINLSSWDQKKQVSNFFSYMYNKEIIDALNDGNNPKSTPSAKVYGGSKEKGLSEIMINLDLVKKLGEIGSFVSYPESLINWDDLFSKVKEYLKISPKSNLPIPLFHDILMKLSYFNQALQIYKNKFNHIQKKLMDYIRQKNISITEEISSKLSELSKISLSNSSSSSGKNPRDYINLAYRIGETLATKESARYNQYKKGILNYKQLFRKNFKNFNIPIILTYKKKKIAKPKLVLLCDVSYSMDVYIKFYLKFFYTLERCYSNIETFTFIDEPVRVSEFFKKMDYNKAFQSVMALEQMNQWRKSDFGHSFEIFFEKYRDLLDKRTIFIIAGDARSNYRNGKTKIFYKLSQRALKTIWLNPETESKWNSGDSMIDYYKPACDHLIACSEPHDLLKLIQVGILKIRESEQRKIKVPEFTQKNKVYYHRHYYDYDYDDYY